MKNLLIILFATFMGQASFAKTTRFECTSVETGTKSELMIDDKVAQVIRMNGVSYMNAIDPIGEIASMKPGYYVIATAYDSYQGAPPPKQNALILLGELRRGGKAGQVADAYVDYYGNKKILRVYDCNFTQQSTF